MIKRSTAIKLVLLGTGAVAIYSATTLHECRPMTAGVLTNGWRPDSTDPARECRARSWRATGSGGSGFWTSGHWGGGSSSSSSTNRSYRSPSTASRQTTTSRGGFGGSSSFHSSGS